MTKHSTVAADRSKARKKPGKPRPDFPLYAHAVGKWAKTIRGKTYYFGDWADPEGALEEYIDQRDDLYAGRTPTAKGGPSVREACNAWLDSPRPKTGVDQRIPLWPETVSALKAVTANRREAAEPADAGLVFLTRFGLRWVRYGFEEQKRHGKTAIRARQDDQLAKSFSKLLDELSLRRKGLGFYGLRHTLETVAGACKDQVAVDAIMGHVDASMTPAWRRNIGTAWTMEDCGLLSIM